MFPFHIVEHVVPCQHIREYPRAVLHDQETVIHLHVKQYIPIDNPNPQPGDVTIIGAHANGFPKELYEPLWEDLLRKSKNQNFRIRSIWIADVAQQGTSGVLNEEHLGNDPSWIDHARDLLHLINLKRSEMPRPIIGIGHSFGGNQLVNVAYMHPRLLTTLILIDPVIQIHSSVPAQAGPNIVQLSTFRRDVWPSRPAAAASLKSSPFYQKWDPRTVHRWIQYGLRDIPTPTQPLNPYNQGSEQVTLTTTKHQEVFTYLRPNYDGDGVNGKPVDRAERPDVDPNQPYPTSFYRAEGPATFLRLKELRPSVLYVFGADSDVGRPEACEAKMKTTGIGVGGSGGAAAGRVKSVTYEGVGHLVAMEACTRTAEDSASWIGKEMERWRAEEEKHEREWKSRPRLERQMVDETWKEKIGAPPGRGAKKQTKL